VTDAAPRPADSPTDTADTTAAERFVDGCLIRRYRIAGGDTVVYDAWEPASIDDGHWMFTSHGGRWWGQIGRGPLPAAVDALPAWSDERSAAFEKWFAAENRRAYVLIVRAFPEAARGRRHDGEITRRLSPPQKEDSSS
jgi:hypothetical protein